MTRKKAGNIVDRIRGLDREKAIDVILDLANNGLLPDPENDPSPNTPSGSIPVYQKPNKKKRRKKPGRKKGHPGKSRKIPDQIDEYKEHSLSACPHCDTPVNDPVESRKRYVEEIPPVKPMVTEHTIHRYWCPCCKKTVEPVFTEAMPGNNIGLRVYIYTAWLHYALGLSTGNLVKILNYLFQFRLTTGALAKGWQKLAEHLKPEYNRIRQRARKSAVLHADETGWRLNGVTHWLWCFSSKDLCYYIIDRTRGSPVLKRFLGEFFQGILICDFYAAYNFLKALAKQRCLYHLFSELLKVDRLNHTASWKRFRKKLSALLKDAVKLWEEKDQLPEKEYSLQRDALNRKLDRLIETPADKSDGRRICRRLRSHRDEILTFLDHANVSPYNNHAEQQMRKPVLVRRIIQQNRSKKGAWTQAVLMTIFRTAELKGENPLTAVESIVKNNLAAAKIKRKTTPKVA